MGGCVDVKSELGKGSTFSVSFKAMYQIAEQLSASSDSSSINRSDINQKNYLKGSKEVYRCSSFMPKALKPAETNNEKKYRVLIVNDELFVLDWFESIFEPYFEVERAENGLQAVHIVSNKPRNYFDLIVLDINMPIMGGLEACERIYQYLS